MFKKSNLLIGSNANEVLEDLINFLPEVNKDAVQLELDDEAMQSAFRRTFPRFAVEDIRFSTRLGGPGGLEFQSVLTRPKIICLRVALE